MGHAFALGIVGLQNSFQGHYKVDPFQNGFCSAKAVVPFEFPITALRSLVQDQIDLKINLQSRLLELEQPNKQRQRRAIQEHKVAQGIMKSQNEKKLKNVRPKEGDMVQSLCGPLKENTKSVTTNWARPYKIFRLYENNSITLRDLNALELLE